MASSGKGGGGGGGEEEEKRLDLEGKTTLLKEGERIVGPTRRPDGTLRKPIKIRAGYDPQDEVVIYQSKGSLWKKEIAALNEVPPGYDPLFFDSKPNKTKSSKRNERKKERRLQAALDKDKNLENNEISPAEDASQGMESAESVASQIIELTISENPAVVAPYLNSTECSTPGNPVPDVEKRIRALKKKIRLMEAQQQKTTQQDMKPEQMEKMAKLESWLKELKLLENKRAEFETS